MYIVKFDRNLGEQKTGITKGPNEEVIYYKVYRINGFGESLAFQVECESQDGKNTFIFDEMFHIERNGIKYYLGN